MRWMWIDRIIEFEANTRMVAVKAVSPNEDYLADHFRDDERGAALPVYPASLMIEGMAQTAGILVGSVNRFRENVILAKVVLAQIDCDVFPGQSIRFEARLDRIDKIGASTRGAVHRISPPETDWQPIGRIDLMFSHIDTNISGLEFPQENFVFAESFRTILREAGLEQLADS